MPKELIVRIVGDPSSLQKAFGTASASAQSFGARMSSIGSSMKRTGRSMSLFVTAPLVLLGKQSYDASRAFEKAMTMVETQAGAPRGEIQKLKEDVVKLGTEGTHGPVDLAKGLFFVESAGFRGAKAMDILKLAEQGATVGGADLGSVTSALTAAMKTGVRGTETATKAMGFLNAIVGQGQMHMEDLVGALSTGVLPTFQNAGLSIKDFGAALDIMTARGVPAQKAATLLRMAVLRMTPTSTKAIGAFKDLGLSQFQLANTMRGPGGLPATIQLLHDKYQALVDRVGKSKASAVMQDIFPKGSVSTILTLIGASDELTQKWKALAKQAGGFSSAVVKSMEDADAKSKRFHATMQALEITIGTLLTPVLQKIADWIARAANAFEKLSPSTQKIIVTIGAIAAVAGPLLIIFGSIIGAISTLIPVFAALASPVGLIVVAVVALVAALVAAVLWPDKLAAALEKLGLSSGQAKAVVEDLQKAVQILVAVFQAVFPPIKTIVEAVVMGIVGELRGLVGIIKGIVDVVSGIFHGDWAQVWKGVQEIVRGAITAVTALLNGWKTILSTIGGLLLQALIAGLKAYVHLFIAFWSGLGSLLKQAAAALPGVALSVGAAIVRGIISGLADLGGKVQAEMHKIPGWLKSAAGAAVAAALSIGAQIASGVAAGMISAGSAAIQAAASYLANLIPGWMKKFLHIGSPSKVMADEVGKPISEGVAKGIKDGTPAVTKAATDAAKKAVEAHIIAYITGLSSFASQAGAAAAKGIYGARAAFETAASVLGRAGALKVVDGFRSQEQTLAQQITQALNQATREAIQKAQQAVKDARGNFATAFGALADAALSAFDAKMAAWKPPAQRQLDKMQLADQIRQEQQAIADAQRQLNEAIATAAQDGTAQNIAAVQSAQQALADAKRQAIEGQLARDAADQQAAHDKEVARDRLHLQDRLAKMQQVLAGFAASGGELTAAEMKKFRQRFGDVLKDFDIPVASLGASIGLALARGITAAIPEAIKAADALADAIAKRFRKKLYHRSPPEEGPMSDDDTWFKNFIPSLLGSVDLAPVEAMGSQISQTLKNAIGAAGGVSSFVDIFRGAGASSGIGDIAAGMTTDTTTLQGVFKQFTDTTTEWASTTAASVGSISTELTNVTTNAQSVTTVMAKVAGESLKVLKGPLAALTDLWFNLSEAIGRVGNMAYYTRAALNDTVDDILRQLARLAGGGINLPGRALGGPVGRSQLYVVGESGPELFIPSSSGKIVPIPKTSSPMVAAGGAGGGFVWSGDVIVEGSVVTERQLAESVRETFLQIGLYNPRMLGGRA